MKVRKMMKVEKKHHTTVEESSSEQQFCELDALPFLSENLVLVGLIIGQQSDETPVDLRLHC